MRGSIGGSQILKVTVVSVCGTPACLHSAVACVVFVKVIVVCVCCTPVQCICVSECVVFGKSIKHLSEVKVKLITI